MVDSEDSQTAGRSASSEVPQNVSLVHPHTFEARPALQQPPPLPDREILRAERRTPDGPPPAPGEFRIVVPFLLGLAIVGLVLITITMAYSAGWQGALVGAAWVVMGYLIAWSVVWGAGLLRVSEERDIEEPATKAAAARAQEPVSPADRAWSR